MRSARLGGGEAEGAEGSALKSGEEMLCKDDWIQKCFPFDVKMKENEYRVFDDNMIERFSSVFRNLSRGISCWMIGCGFTGGRGEGGDSKKLKWIIRVFEL